MEIKFEEALPDPVTLILYATFPEVMTIDQSRNVQLEVKDKLNRCVWAQKKKNTKQLWTALTLNKVTNPYFDGVYSLDTLVNIIEKLHLIICNTQPSDQSGEHWVLFFFEEDSVDFYDSLGKDITEYGHNPLRVLCVDIIVCIMLMLNVMVILWKKL